MRFALPLLTALVAAPAWACPTCAAPAMPGLDVDDQWPGYPTLHRRRGPKLQLEGVEQLGAALRGASRPRPRLRLLVVSDPLLMPSVAAGFSWSSPAFDLHVCGPELTVAWALP